MIGIGNSINHTAASLLPEIVELIVLTGFYQHQGSINTSTVDLTGLPI